jgi:hypothetical protein
MKTIGEFINWVSPFFAFLLFAMTLAFVLFQLFRVIGAVN